MDRDEFMELVYETFADEPDNVLANRIIEAADAYVEHEKAQLSQEDTTSDTISRQEAIDALDCINGVEEVLRSLPTIQPESSDKFIPPEQLAIKLGTATTRSAMQWIEFCNALEFLGYAIVERRVK